jgi:polar amino acid transport system substrate-binding protein
MRSRVIVIMILALALAVALAGAACGGDDGAGEATTATTAATGEGTDVAALVPEEIRSKGTLIVAADATYAPNEFIGADGETVEGMDPDLAKALGEVLGLEIEVVNASFDTIIPGLQSGKYDLGMSSFTDTKEREQVVDFVTYFTAGTSFYVKAGGPAIATLDDLCGHSVAVQRGTVQADDANAQSTKCTDAGQSAVTVSVYPDQNAANLAISSGRAEVGMADSPVAAYIVGQSNGQFELTGEPYNSAPYGIAIPKDNGLATPVLEALKELMANGTYESILAQWGVQDGAITNPQVNGAID